MIGSDLVIDKKLWLKTVDDLQVQNNNLKEGLTAILRQEISPTLLSSLESFQTQLLDKDAAVALLRYDVTALVAGMRNGGDGIATLLVRLGQDILSMEDDLARMKIQLASLKEEIAGRGNGI